MDTDELFQKNKKEACVSITSNYSSRQKNLFEELDKAAETFKHNMPQNESMDFDETAVQSNKQKRSETKHFRNKESLFKRPEMPISKCLKRKSTADYHRHPQKWTKYTLSDVSSDDMSEQSNTTAALSFLRELEERKNNEVEEKVNLENAKITFKKRTVQPQYNSSAMLSDKVENEEDKKVFQGSKIVMPEYIIGQKTKAVKKEKKVTDSPANRKEIKLNHLLDEDDDN